MRIVFLTFILALINLHGNCQVNVRQRAKISASKIQITWVNTLTGDFSFVNNWSYPEGVYKNSYGQLSCDGLCPEGIDSMIDSKGRIRENSIIAFYKLVDTTHEYQSIDCEAQCDEFDEAKFVHVEKKNDTVQCYTLCNVATHCSLHMDIVNNTSTPFVRLNSIMPNSSNTFQCMSGFIKIDRSQWERGIMKAAFNLKFKNTNSGKTNIFWKGMILKKIE